MDIVKHRLLQEICPDLSLSEIHSGYHRGRRAIFGNIYYPDIISIRHLHLHVIIRPRLLPRLFEYPAHLSFIWKSDAEVMQTIQKLGGEASEKDMQII